MTDPAVPRRRVSPIAIVCLIIEVVLLVLFVPGLAYVEVLQHDGPGGPGNALGFAITLVVVALILVAASAVAFVRDHRAGFPVGFAVASIVLGVVLAVAHGGIFIPNAIT